MPYDGYTIEQIKAMLDAADPATLTTAATSFGNVATHLETLAPELLEQSKNLAGEGGKWTGDGANAFFDASQKVAQMVDNTAQVLSAPNYQSLLSAAGDTLTGTKTAIEELYQQYQTALADLEAQIAAVPPDTPMVPPAEEARQQLVDQANQGAVDLINGMANVYAPLPGTLQEIPVADQPINEDAGADDGAAADPNAAGGPENQPAGDQPLDTALDNPELDTALDTPGLDDPAFANLGGPGLGGPGFDGFGADGVNLDTPDLDAVNLDGPGLDGSLGGPGLDGLNLDTTDLDTANLDSPNLGSPNGGPIGAGGLFPGAVAPGAFGTPPGEAAGNSVRLNVPKLGGGSGSPFGGGFMPPGLAGSVGGREMMERDRKMLGRDGRPVSGSSIGGAGISPYTGGGGDQHEDERITWLVEDDKNVWGDTSALPTNHLITPSIEAEGAVLSSPTGSRGRTVGKPVEASRREREKALQEEAARTEDKQTDR